MQTAFDVAQSLVSESPEYVYTICEEAQRRFALCGAGDDFCLQSRTGQSIVFGGTNRVTWNARRGFRPDRSLCTDRFLRLWDEVID